MTVYPWAGWYHCIGNTHGTWVRGDDRGWRSRHHREHVEGDYKHRPPPGKYEKQHRQSEVAMKRPAVVLSTRQRTIVCEALAEKLLRDGVEVAGVVVTGTHLHLVARFPNHESPGMAMPGLSAHNIARRGAGMIDPAPRHFVGRAKKHSSHILRERELGIDGGAWAVRAEILPVECAEHFRFLIDAYLPRHVREEGGVLWKGQWV